MPDATAVLDFHKKVCMQAGASVNERQEIQVATAVVEPYNTNLNRLLAWMMSPLTASLRVDGALTVDIAEFHTDLAPYPHTRFTLSSDSLIISVEKAYHEELSVLCADNFFVDGILANRRST